MDSKEGISYIWKCQLIKVTAKSEVINGSDQVDRTFKTCWKEVECDTWELSNSRRLFDLICVISTVM